MKFNVVLTLVEMTRADRDPGRASGRWPRATATSADHRLHRLRRQGPVPRRDRWPRRSRSSRWSASRTRSTWSRRPRTRSGSSRATMLTGLGIAVIIYMLVAISVVTVLTPERARRHQRVRGPGAPRGGHRGAPDFPIDKVFPFLAVFAVANTALINMLMASRLIYGMANQDVLPRITRHGLAEPPRAVGRHHLLHRPRAGPDRVRRHPVRQPDIVTNLSGTTALLLLGVFTVVNVACLVLRRDRREGFFRSPGPTPRSPRSLRGPGRTRGRPRPAPTRSRAAC